MTILSNFQPRRRLLSAVSNATSAVLTTTEDHGYTVGLIVRILVPSAYGMSVEYARATVLAVPADDQITVDLDTSLLAAFSAPSEPPAFTAAQVWPVTGTTDNETSITGT